MIAQPTLSPKEVVRHFLNEVRSGLHPEHAAYWMAETVQAHQIISESEQVISRTAADYAEHVREMWAESGPFTLEIESLLADGDQVYARWRQHGQFTPPGGPTRPLIELASAVYEVHGGKITAYSIQIDRLGLMAQRGELSKAS